MAINQLIAQGIRPIGADVPEIGNLLQQMQQRQTANALASRNAAVDEQNAANYASSLSQQEQMRTAAASEAKRKQALEWASNAVDTVRQNPALIPQFIAQGKQRGILPPETPDQATPDQVEEFALRLGIAPKAKPEPITAQTIGGFRVLTQGGKPISGGVQAPERPQAAGGEKGPNKQLVTRPTPDGRQQDYAFNPQTSQLEPVGEPYAKTAPLSPKDTTTAKQKLTQIAIAKQQLANAKAKFLEIKDSLSAGAGGGLLPTPKGKAFDAAIDGMRGSITALTRVPGVGAMSDYETRLDQAKFPTRNDYEDVIAQKLDQLDALIGGLDTGYRDLLGGASDTVAPADAGAPKPGMVQDGYRFKGGNPADKANWVKVGK